ncbi:FMN-dependent NADH-azoreductase [Roseibium sp.]|uniref:FMN-dependent NADH-azoreductase n=1 Tax=Roseibium sp. TaxID=1936156 RepID=UPI003B51E5DE
MTTILRLDASTRVSGSLSRALADTFQENLAKDRQDLTVIRRDVGKNPPFLIDEDWIAAAFEPETTRTEIQKGRLKLSDTLIEELQAADLILISSPLYNYGIPAGLKAWVDQVIRIGKTFTFDLARGDRPLEPIFSGKTLVLASASGEFGFGPGELNDGRNHLVAHLQTLTGYLGAREMHHVSVEYQEFKDARHAKSLESAHHEARELAKRLSGDIDAAAA